MTTNRNAWKDMSLGQLLGGISSASGMYASEASRKDAGFKDLDQLPEAMLYRARVIEQFVNEIKARAWDLQQEEYDNKSTEGKIEFHEKEIESLRESLDEAELDFDLMDEISDHMVCLGMLSLPSHTSKFTFGDK